MDTYKLYGMPASLYTGKVRSYLRKQRIPFVEYGANSEDFFGRVVPETRRFIIPVIETPDGDLVQDGADIIDYFEERAAGEFSVYPDSPLLNSISLLFELFGGEGLLRPAMHYRWNFDEENLTFLRDEFVTSLAPIGSSAEQGDALFKMASGRMRAAASSFGVTRESAPLIEASFLEFLSLFADHLKLHPFLLGGRPTIGDFGLVAALHAHLDRDPAATVRMRQHAPAVARWVERMHAPEQTWVEHVENTDLIVGNVPDTLMALMSYVSQEYLPEILAHVSFANDWLEAHGSLEAGTNGLDKPSTRSIGEAAFEWRGISLKTGVMPYRFYLLQRLQDCYESASTSSQSEIQEVFKGTGLELMLSTKTLRRVERDSHLEVWGPLRSE